MHYYVHLKSNTTRGVVQGLIKDPGAHCDVCKGNDDQCHDYVWKDDSRLYGPWERGTRMKQGDRSDLQVLRTKIKAGATNQQLATDPETESAFFLHGRHVAEYRAALQVPVERDHVHVAVIWGPTNIGKTHWALRLAAELGTWYRLVTSKDADSHYIWDGYSGELTVILDEFHDKKVSMTTLLTWLDRFPLMLDRRYGTTPALYTNVIITSQHHPQSWYADETVERRAALARRITTVLTGSSREDLEQNINTARSADP